ncbi:Pyridoxal-dependent decarboxylase [Plesiocystis pacifica SIR-1]|uniref:Pyridoxal-dependent decarboxylase n=1 Tax=Plesiocystis pacifica SIR-1 TaxID=391625 RepID=A6G0Y9_9BACT|nr:pyridoxal-dependent decarboxylase [Plesiocystis pacifica]EDM80527.1 Pyridoxal-dependent decarboxylase [Plesiocystis pacifica SIR-1]
MHIQPLPPRGAQPGGETPASSKPQASLSSAEDNAQRALARDPRTWAQTPEGMARFAGDLDLASLAERESFARTRGPLPPGSAPGTAAIVLERALSELGPATLPERGLGERRALELVSGVLARHGLDLSHPNAVAHLQPPTLAVAAAADTLASVVNSSVDTFDSGPSSVAIERWVVEALIDLAGLGADADGVLTPGGSMSNLLGLLLARDSAARRLGIDARRDGVAGLRRPVVLCSAVAHFSVHRACAALGLGEGAVVPVPVDRCRRMDTAALRRCLAELDDDQTPIAIIATAGTTDFGSVDPLVELATIAHERGVWFHVDAAYGFGALFSRRLAPRLEGLHFADSITLDLHKLGWQPAATSVLLVAKPDAFASTERNVEYLNPLDEAQAGYTGLLGRSLQTTRRADAVKVAATFLGLGRAGLGAMVDACHELARHGQAWILDHPELELVCAAELTTIVFRYRPRLDTAEANPESESASESESERLDRVNAAIRRRLLASGEALVGRTRVDVPGEPSRLCLKFTLINPRTRPEQLEALLERIVATGRRELEAQETPE